MVNVKQKREKGSILDAGGNPKTTHRQFERLGIWNRNQGN